MIVRNFSLAPKWWQTYSCVLIWRVPQKLRRERIERMLLARLRRGILCVETNGLQRFFAPTVWQRLYLLWVFRHFRRLPLGVLSESNRACVERVCNQPAVAGDPDLVMGVVECELTPLKKAPQPAPLFRTQTSEPNRAAQ
jgi:hypothetical protein